MLTILKIEIKCESCGNVFPSPVFFSDEDSFNQATIEEETVKCPHCFQAVTVKKAKMIITYK